MESLNSCCNKLKCNIGMNRACLTIYNNEDIGIIVHMRNGECLNCPFTNVASIQGYSNSTITIDTIYSHTLSYSYENDSDFMCPTMVEVEEASTYVWDINKSLEQNCSMPYCTEPGRNIYMPFVVLMAILVIATVIYFVTDLFVRKAKKTRPATESDEPRVEPTQTINQLVNHLPEKAVDTFSGLCLLLLMFFNYNEEHYAFARHSVWNGIKFPDLIMPWFLWIFGFSISPNVFKDLRRGTSRYMIIVNVFLTSVKLIILGLMLSSINKQSTYENIPFTGSLQQIGIIYFMIATIEAIFCIRHTRDPNLDCMVPELATSPFQWLTYATIMVAYIAVYCASYAPGCPTMYFGPGGAAYFMEYFNCTGGISGYLDRIVFGGHIAVNTELLEVYGGLPFNKYGILPTISASLAMFSGYNAGKTYYLNKCRIVISGKMALGSFLAIFVCGILSGFSKNFGMFPLNYNLMSLSLMLLASSFANLIHLGLAWSIDWLKLWDGKPLYYLGKNVLLIYVLHIILNPCFPIFWITRHTNVLHCQYVIISAWAITLFTALAAYLHEKNIFVSL